MAPGLARLVVCSITLTSHQELKTSTRTSTTGAEHYMLNEEVGRPTVDGLDTAAARTCENKA
eukprot:5414599-Amphidinium_carterae.1